MSALRQQDAEPESEYVLTDELRESARQAAITSARSQGLPDVVTDQNVLDQIATIARG